MLRLLLTRYDITFSVATGRCEFSIFFTTFSEEIITFSGLWNHPFCSAFRSSQCMLFAQVIFVCLSRQDFAAVKRKKKWQPFSDKRSFFFFLGPLPFKEWKISNICLAPQQLLYHLLHSLAWMPFLEVLLDHESVGSCTSWSLSWSYYYWEGWGTLLHFFNKNLLFRTSMELALIYGCLLQVRVTVMEESWLNASWSCRPPKICVLCVSSCGKGWWDGIWTRCSASVLQGYLPTYFWVLCRPVLKRQQAAESP
jgi:hypothetical protein